MLRTCSMALLVSAIAATAQSPAALAQTTAAAAAPAPSSAPNQSKTAQKKSNDPVLCEVEDTIGTRLGAKKVCMTASQWQERRRDVQLQMTKLEQLGEVSH